VDVGSTCSHDGDQDTGRGAHGRQLSLAHVTATTALVVERADIGSTCSRDSDDNAGRDARGRQLLLA